MMQKFYTCKRCGNMVGMIHDSGAPLVCCGETMGELKPNTVDASTEKHVPVVTVAGNKVTVKIGNAPHPMTAEHNIPFVYLKTEHGGQRKNIMPSEKPEVTFSLDNDKALSVFAYCNLHGMWKTDLKK